MRKKICPVCDRELTAAGYCRLCRRLVFKPVVRDVDYYLNENRPDNQTLLNQKRIGEENQLESGGKTDLREKMAGYCQKAMKQAENLQKGIRTAGEKTEKGRKKSERARPVYESSGTSKKAKVRVKTSGFYRSEEKKKGRTVYVVIAIVVCLIVINLFFEAAGRKVDRLTQSHQENAAAEWSQENSASKEPEYGYGVTELDEAEIMAAGTRCDGEEHFSCSITDMDRRLDEVISQLGLQAEKDEYTDNYIIYSDEDSYKFYDTCTYCVVLDENGEECLSVLLNGDTVTGEVHRVSVNAFSPDENETAAEILRQLADFAAGEEGTVKQEEILEAVGSENELSRPAYNYVIYVYDYEGEGLGGSLMPLQNREEESGAETL